MKRRPHWKFFCPKTPCSHLNGCVEESRVVPPWTKASERYVSFHLSIIVIIVFLISWIYATFPLSMSFSLRERIGGVRSKIVLEISTELHVSASSSPWKWPHVVLGQKNFHLGLRSVMSITYFSFFYFFFKVLLFYRRFDFFSSFFYSIRHPIRDPIHHPWSVIDAVTPLPAQENQLCKFFFSNSNFSQLYRTVAINNYLIITLSLLLTNSQLCSMNNKVTRSSERY